MIDNNLDLYFNEITSKQKRLSIKSLKFIVETLYRGINFKNKTMLEIGGGIGIYSFYAAAKGAKKVVMLEPEFDGSSVGMISKFHEIAEKLQFSNVVFHPKTFQEYEAKEGKFDIVLMYNSINHLNEEACERLNKDANARELYKEIFDKLYSLMNKDAILIVSDCSRYNFFQLLGIKNPISPTIEWHKHQTPELWTKLLINSGFSNPDIEWYDMFKPLGSFGKSILGHKIPMYFLNSHFCFRMKKE